MTDDPISERDGPTLAEMERDLETWRKALTGNPRSCQHPKHRTCTEPTRRQLEVFMRYLMVGGEKEAARDAGMALGTLKNLFSDMYDRCGVSNAAQMAYLVGRGWL